VRELPELRAANSANDANLLHVVSASVATWAISIAFLFEKEKNRLGGCERESAYRTVTIRVIRVIRGQQFAVGDLATLRGQRFAATYMREIHATTPV
jgi:hypothetical protein